MTASEVNVLDLVAVDYLVIDESSVKALEEVLN
jgi:ribosomal protein L4